VGQCRACSDVVHTVVWCGAVQCNGAVQWCGVVLGSAAVHAVMFCYAV
jgi:hypothetical protein